MRNDETAPLSAVIVVSDLDFGGAQRQVVELVNHMDPSVCKTHVCSLSDFVPLAKTLRQPGHLSLVLRRFRFDFTVVPRLASVLRKLEADIVHAYLFDATISARLAGRLAGRPAVISSERNTDYTFKRGDLMALRATERFNDLTIANSRAGAAFNSRVFHRPLSRYRVIHNGVDIERFAPRDGSRIRKELGLTESQPIAGMFASFKPQKNHLVWLRAARRVIARVPDLKLLFLGDELHKDGSGSIEFKQEVTRTVADLGLGGHCLFLGNKPEVEDYYNACTLTVLPSLFEGTPNVALESMACGVPVVVSDVSDNAYIVRDGQTGLVVPLNDEEALAAGVCKLLLDPDLRQQMSRQARAWAGAEFSCSRLAEKTAAVYREAIALRTPGRRDRRTTRQQDPPAGCISLLWVLLRLGAMVRRLRRLRIGH